MHRAEPWAAGRIPGSELFLQSILASAAKETPVLVSALVFLLKTSSVILHSAPLLPRGGLLSVYVTKPPPEFHQESSVLTVITKQRRPVSSQCVRVQLERLTSESLSRLLCSK